MVAMRIFIISLILLLSSTAFADYAGIKIEDSSDDEILPEKGYFRLRLREMLVRNSSAGWLLGEYVASVHCHVTYYDVDSQTYKTYDYVSPPSRFKGKHRLRFNDIILPPTPYVSEPIRLEIALLRIRENDKKLKALLDSLATISKAVPGLQGLPAATVSQAIQGGVEGFKTFERENDAHLVSLETTILEPKGNFMVLYYAEGDSFDDANLKLVVDKPSVRKDPSVKYKNEQIDPKKNDDGERINYALIEFESVTSREDWRAIPGLRV